MNTTKAATFVSSAVKPAKQDENQSKFAYLHVSVKTIPLSLVKRDPKTQQRTGLNLDTVEEYQEAISLGAKFPPIKVRFDGKHYYLWDGFHTVQAFLNLNKTEIEAEITPGNLRDAILDSVGANSTHGLRRTREDKRKAVKALLYDEEWMEWSNRKIAKHCKVSESLVRTIKKKIGFKSDKILYQDKHGNQSQMISNTENDDTIITAFKRSDNLENDINNTKLTSNTQNDDTIITSFKRGDSPKEDNDNTQVRITSEWRKGEIGIIVQRPDANSAIVEFNDGTRDIFSKHAFAIVENESLLGWNSGDKQVDKLLNTANKAFDAERPVQKIGRKIVNKELQVGDIVLIDPSDRIDPRLVGYKGKHAKITQIHDHSFDLQIWGTEIGTVATTDLRHISSDFVSQGVSIKLQDYAFLLDNFSSLEEVIEYAVSKKK